MASKSSKAVVINRRQFLVSLAALGAAVALPADPSPAQIDEAWRALEQSPWFFEINDSGTVVEPGEIEPKIRSDVYDIHTAGLRTERDLINEVDCYDELRSRFQLMASDELDEAQSKLQDNEIRATERAHLLRLEAALADADEGWKGWVRLEGDAALPRFRTVIDAWLAEKVDWMQMEHWPDGWSAQGKALNFFRSLPAATLEEIGVVIVEGDNPGSTYFAAELRAPIDQANLAAGRLGLPFRFKAEQSTA